MLTPKQAESVATALAMRPEAERSDMLTCPACGITCVSMTTRRHMGLIRRIPCPHCGALLRLKRGRTVLAAFLLLGILAGLGAYIGWPADRHVVQSFAAPFWVLTFVVFSATLRRLPLTAH